MEDQLYIDLANGLLDQLAKMIVHCPGIKVTGMHNSANMPTGCVAFKCQKREVIVRFDITKNFNLLAQYSHSYTDAKAPDAALFRLADPEILYKIRRDIMRILELV